MRRHSTRSRRRGGASQLSTTERPIAHREPMKTGGKHPIGQPRPTPSKSFEMSVFGRGVEGEVPKGNRGFPIGKDASESSKIGLSGFISLSIQLRHGERRIEIYALPAHGCTSTPSFGLVTRTTRSVQSESLKGKHPLRILVTTEMTAEPTHLQYCVRTCIIQFQSLKRPGS